MSQIIIDDHISSLKEFGIIFTIFVRMDEESAYLYVVGVEGEGFLAVLHSFLVILGAVGDLSHLKIELGVGGRIGEYLQLLICLHCLRQISLLCKKRSIVEAGRIVVGLAFQYLMIKFKGFVPVLKLVVTVGLGRKNCAVIRVLLCQPIQHIQGISIPLGHYITLGQVEVGGSELLVIFCSFKESPGRILCLAKPHVGIAKIEVYIGKLLAGRRKYAG